MTDTRLLSSACAVVVGLCFALPYGASADVPIELRAIVGGNSGLERLYEPIQYRALWLTSDGTLSDQGRDALRLLRRAGDDGLDPSHYAAPDLDALAAAIATGQRQSPLDRAQFDAALSQHVLRYLSDVHRGRVDPAALGFQLGEPRGGHPHDFAALVREAVGSGRIVDAARSLRPRSEEYPALAAELDRYRERAAIDEPPLQPVVKSVHPGDAYPQALDLWARLVLLGDAPAEATWPAVGNTYSGAVVDAVRRFQARHGLDPDGVLGRQTLAALAVPLASRVRQIELAMERLRWLPHESSGPLVLVNIPMFELFAWDEFPPGGAAAFSARVIVGKARTTPTPVFRATLNEVIFRPAWNVPRSIVRQEMLPMLARHPDYFERNDMELVAGQGDDSPVVAATPGNIAQLRSGRVRVRQRPGPQNALGLVKFSFPNPNDVYMHATPAPALFARSRRDFSHGCVRVQDPVGLSEWILKGETTWTREQIEAAMNAAEPSRVSVRPVQVILFYTTATVRLESGRIAFADDIYGLDPRLDAAMRAR